MRPSCAEADGGAARASRAATARERARAPGLGIACGSLGALAGVAADRAGDALDRVVSGTCDALEVPALEVRPDAGDAVRALNDLVVVRAGAGQVRVIAWLDGALY